MVAEVSLRPRVAVEGDGQPMFHGLPVRDIRRIAWQEAHPAETPYAGLKG